MASPWDTLAKGSAAAKAAIDGSVGARWALFIGVIVLTWILARLVGRLLFHRVLRTRRIELAIRLLLRRVFVFATLVAAVFLFSSLIFEANLAALAAAVGLISLAVGFGLQNVIANIAGGISLALDRPFRIGDEIQVGEIVGNVQEIGIRSTRILTRRKEYVVIPNKILEEQFITNYTMVYPELRLDVEVPVGYDADRERAEEILLEIAVAHPVVLRNPAPRVLVREFGESGVDLELRSWISHPRNRETVKSDLLKSAQNRFEQEGIGIAYPHRVLVQQDRAAPRPARLTSKTWTDPRRSQRKLLIPIPGGEVPTARARYAVALCKALKGQAIGLYIGRPKDRNAGEDGGRILHELETEASEAGIWYKPILRVAADEAQAIADVAREEDVDLIVLGVERGRFAFEGVRIHESHAVAQATLRERACTTPVHALPAAAKLSPGIVEDLEARIAEFRKGEPTTRVPSVEVSHPEPPVSAVPTPPPEGPRGAAAAAQGGVAKP